MSPLMIALGVFFVYFWVNTSLVLVLLYHTWDEFIYDMKQSPIQSVGLVFLLTITMLPVCVFIHCRALWITYRAKTRYR